MCTARNKDVLSVTEFRSLFMKYEWVTGNGSSISVDQWQWGRSLNLLKHSSILWFLGEISLILHGYDISFIYTTCIIRKIL